jgi:methionine aminopeptidase
MRRSGAVVREVLEHVRALVKPGVTTLDLENAAESKMAEFGATSAFKGYRGYPCVLCTSVNEQVVHGIPSKERVLREGDIVSIDTGVVLDGYYGDSAITVPVGAAVAPKTKRLLDVTRASLETAIKVVRPGATLGDIGAAVQEVVEADGFQCSAGVCGPWNRDPDARRSAGSQLRAAGYGNQAARRNGAGHRAHGECGQAGCAGIERRLDGGNRGWKLERSLRTHRGGDGRRRCNFDAVGKEACGMGIAGRIGITFVEGRRD